MGHSVLECPTPAARNDDGKLPYDVNLRAQEEKKRRMQSFAAAAADSFGSGSSSGVRQSSQPIRSASKDSKSADGSRHLESHVGNSEEHEVQSPLKQNPREVEPKVAGGGPNATRQLFQAMDTGDKQKGPRKRKSKPPARVVQTPDLNISIGGGSNALIPAGLVSSRVNQLDGAGDSGGNSMIEILKRQKRGNNQHEGSAAAASDSPRREP